MKRHQSPVRKIMWCAALLLVTLFGATSALAQGAFTLLTPQTQNNGQSGVSFTIEAINTVKIWRLGANTDGGNITMSIWYKLGDDAVKSPAPPVTGWTQIGASTPVNMGNNTNTQIPIDIDMVIQQGQTVSFAIMTASTSINYTTGGTGLTQDVNIKINGQGWGCSSGNPFNMSFFPRGYNGGVYYDFAGAKWTGATSDSWNDASNWEPVAVPDKEAAIIIPDASTTENDCKIPVGAECKGVKIEKNGILIGDVGTLNNYGDWTNEGGVFVPGTALISYVGTKGQDITTGGAPVGDIHIKNTSEPVNVLDSWSAAQSGKLTADVGTNMIFVDPMLDFANTTVDNKGLFNFGITGGGVVATAQDITAAAGVNLGVVEVNAIDAMDAVNFLSEVSFSNLTVKGLGAITFSNDVELLTRFETTMEGMLTFSGGITGDAELRFNSIADPIVTGSIQAKSLFHENDGSLTFGAMSLTGDANFITPSPTATATFTGGIDVMGDFNVDGLSAAPAAVTVNGALTVGGDTNFLKGSVAVTGVLNGTGALNMQSSGTVTFGVGASTASDLNFDATGALTLTGALSVAGVTVLNSGDLSIGANLEITGNMLDDGLGKFEIGGSLRARAAASQTLSVLATRPVKTNFIRIEAGGAELRGYFVASSTSSFFPALRVLANSGLILGHGARIELGTVGIGNGFARIDGALSTSTGAGTLRPVISGHPADNEKAVIDFRSNSTISLDGMVFDNVGEPAGDFGIRLRPDVRVVAFNYVSVLNCAAAIAAISIETDNVPGVIQDFEVSGTAPANFDASTLSGFTIQIKKPKVSPGNLYGVPFEIDPNSVLYWEDPPVLSFLTLGTLPNVLVENPLNEALSAVGGNAPYLWTLLNAPAWMSIDPNTGTLSGTPPRDAVGQVTFVVFLSDSTTPSLTTSKIFSLAVDALVAVPIDIVTPKLISGKIGEPYSYALTAVGGTGKQFTWHAINPNQLPPGLILREDGVVIGTPEAGSQGLFVFAVRVTDSQGNAAVENFSLTINSEFSDPAIIGNALSDGAGGGCALGTGSAWMLAIFALLLALVAVRGLRREAV